MSGSAVLDTALGVVFVFLAASLICSGIVEWVSNKLDKRGEYLLRGLREMLDLRPGVVPAELPQDGLLENKKALHTKLADLAATGDALFRPGATLPPSGGAPEEVADLPTVVLPDDPDDPAYPAAVAVAAAADTPMAARVHAAGPGHVAARPYLADLVLARPVVAGLHRPEVPASPGKAGWSARLPRWKRDLHLTSYLSAETFARALLDLLVPDADGTTTLTHVRARVGLLPKGTPGRETLEVLAREAEGDVTRFRRSLEHWYDEQMGRVSGWYKRWSQWRLFIAGALLAIVANVSTIAVAQALYTDGPVRDAVVAQAQAAQVCPDDDGGDLDCEREQLDVLQDLTVPIGWDVGDTSADCRAANEGDACGWNPAAWGEWAGDSLSGAGVSGVLLRLLGWLLTAAAVSFGAPFWFDALGKLGSLRTAGRPPRPVPGS